MRLFMNTIDMSIDSNITSNHDDVSRYRLLTSSRNRRQSELFSQGTDILNFAKSCAPRKSTKDDRTMGDLSKKLSDLEKRTASLHIVYDNLLSRAVDLESRSLIFEMEFSQEKNSFDIVEFLMKQDGRSKAMFDHVSLFFYVLLFKLKLRGIEMSSTTELWSRLGDEDVKTAFENTVSNLGFSKREIQCLNVILDVLHERDLTANVNRNEVNTNNLSAKLKDLSSEFIVVNPQTDDEEDVGVSENETTTRTTGFNSSLISQDNEIESSAISGSACYQQMNVTCGDTFDVDSLLLYLQIQNELDPIVRSVLRRAVAISHCSMIKTPEVVVGDRTLQTTDFTDDLDPQEQIIIPSCINEAQHSVRSSTFEFSEQANETSLRPHHRFRSPSLQEIECDDDFDELVTSTPKSVKPPRYKEANQSNNALVTDELNLFIPVKMGESESTDCSDEVNQFLKVPNHRQLKISRPVSLDFPDSKHHKRYHKSKLNTVSDHEDHPLGNGDFDTLSRIESFLTSQKSSTPEEGQERIEHFRSFYKRRLRRKTAEFLKAERDSIKWRITPPLPRTNDELKSKVNVECNTCKEERPQLSKFIYEIYEADRVNDIEDFSDSEYTSASSSLLSSYHFNSDTSCSVTARDDDDKSMSLHEELSELGFFQYSSPKDISNDDISDQVKGLVSSSGTKIDKAPKEHVNFFSSPDSVNPYAYEFDADYYMLWPGQEMEIEMKDLSSEVYLDTDKFEKSEQSFTNSLTSENKFDSWLIL